MKEFWLNLEPYVFLWNDEKRVLLYNTLSKKSHLYQFHDSVKKIIEGLKDENNLYCITVKESDINNPIIKDFITFIRYSYCGDLIDKEVQPFKPVVVYPQLNINEDIYRDLDTINNNERLGNKIANNLSCISIYLGGKCDYDCVFCGSKYKQIKWCTKSGEVMGFEELCLFLNNLDISPISSVSFFCGNSLFYSYWKDLLIVLKKHLYTKDFYFDYRIFLDYYAAIMLPNESDYNIVLLINNLNETIKIPEIYNTCKFVFSIESIEDFHAVSNIIGKNNLENILVLPFYNSTNMDFFNEFVYLTENDIISSELSRNQIFSNKVLNSNFFGKMTLFADGNIYSN